jgi:hypothetical protein
MNNKQPFCPETRNRGNLCFCAACGAHALADTMTAGTRTWRPERWQTRSIEHRGSSATVYACAACASANVDGAAAQAFFDRNNMIWESARKVWRAELVPA